MFSSVGGFRFLSGGALRAGIYVLQGLGDVAQAFQTINGTSFFTGDRNLANNDIIVGQISPSSTFSSKSLTGTSTNEVPTNMVLDSSLNQIVVGITNANTVGNNDMYLTKFNSAGNIVWQRTIGTSARDDLVDVVVTDNDANIIAVGSSNLSTNAFIGKFSSSNGAVLTQNTMNAYTTVDSVASDSSNNIYLAITQNSTPDGVLALKMQSDFTKTWGQYIEYGSLDLEGKGIAVDSGGNVYVTVARDVSNEDFLLKFNSSGTLQWQTGFNFGTLNGFTSIVTDPSNNIYIAGDFGSPSVIQLLKFDTNGNLVWGRGLNGYNGNLNVNVNNISIYNNNILINGSTDFNGTTYGMITQVPADGTKQGTYANGYVWGTSPFSLVSSSLTTSSTTGPAFTNTSLTDNAGTLTDSSYSVSIFQNIQF